MPHNQKASPASIDGAIPVTDGVALGVGNSEASSADAAALVSRSTGHVTWTTDPRGNVEDVSPAWLLLTGQTADEVRKGGWVQAIHPDDRERVAKIWQTSLANKSLYALDYRVRTDDGAYRWFLVRGLPVLDADGQVQRWMGFMADVTEHHEQRRRLEASEARFRAIFEQAAVGIARVGLDGRWLQVNDRLCHIVGYTSEELLAGTFQDLTHPDDLADDLAQVEALVRGDATNYSLEKRYIRKDGSLIWINLTVALVRNAAGQPDYFISVVEDISERKRLAAEVDAIHQELAETALLARRSAARLEATFAALSDAITVVDADGATLLNNRQAVDLLAKVERPEEYDALSLQGRGDLFAPRDRNGRPLPPEEWPITRVLRGETLVGPDTVDMRVRALGGRDVVVNVSATPLRDEHGQLIGGVVASRDITERVGLEDLARRQAIQLDALKRANAVGIVVADTTTVLEANDAFLRIVGYTRADLETGAIDWPAMTPPEYLALDQQAFAQFFASGSCEPYRKEFWRKDGSRVPILGSAALLSREPLVVVAIVLDMTEQQRLEREREQMVQIVGHELGTPLTSLKMRVQILQRRLAAAQLADADLVAKAVEDVERLQRLVADLNEGAQLERGTLHLERQRVDLTALCGACAADLELQGGRPITRDLPDQPVTAEVDPERIRQVLVNLVNNALKYTPPEADITITLTSQGDHARLVVRDTGPGIPADALPRLFERFFRVPHAEIFTRGSHVGVGLGLNIARTIVEANGGQMGVESAAGQGTTFWFTLPLAPTPTDADA